MYVAFAERKPRPRLSEATLRKCKATLWDAFVRSVCDAVAVGDQRAFEAKVREGFGAFCDQDPNIMSQLKHT